MIFGLQSDLSQILCQLLVRLNLSKVNLCKTYQKHYLQREAYTCLKTPALETEYTVMCCLSECRSWCRRIACTRSYSLVLSQTHAYNPSAWEVEAGVLEFRVIHLWLHSQMEVHLGQLRPCLQKATPTPQKKQKNKNPTTKQIHGSLGSVAKSISKTNNKIIRAHSLISSFISLASRRVKQ